MARIAFVISAPSGSGDSGAAEIRMMFYALIKSSTQAFHDLCEEPS
jgi:hypothetical protein